MGIRDWFHRKKESVGAHERKQVKISKTKLIEHGPVYRKAIATIELLNNKRTAVHYQKGRIDAMGEEIVIGKEMDFVDYRGQWGWHCYELRPVYFTSKGEKTFDETKGRPGKTETMAWFQVGIELTEEAAIRRMK